MNRLALIFCWAVAIAFAQPARSATFKFPNQTLTVPDGFEVQQVAGPPLVDRPISADFDEQGRLYVTDSSGSNDKIEKQLQERPHRIVRLEDTDGDGRFDKSTVFADKMSFPEGAMWFDGSFYVGAPPTIWKLTDTDGDGVADKREEWFQGKTATGCANDLHGPYLGPDGWIYWCKGAFAKQSYERPGKSPFVTRASHIFRCRPDGTGIEPVMTGGMDNPVEVAFTPEGERIFTTTFFQHPGGGQRDGLIHAIYGGVYGKSHDVLDDHKKTGDLMPVLTQLGAAAPCGLTRYESRVFGSEFQNNLFACLFNLHKVTRHVLEPVGATFKTHDTDLVTSDSTDFHPTDVIEDADGSLLVIDTGGWYKLCCPTSQLAKPDVLGAIYRIRRKGAPRIDDPRGLTIAWAEMKTDDLVKLLGDDRPIVRHRAIQAFAKKGTKAVPGLREAAFESVKSINNRKTDLTLTQLLGTETRRNAVWALTRIEGTEARETVRAVLADPDPSVRLAAIHSVSVWRDAGALPRLMELLKINLPQLQRAAAEAIGRMGDKSAVPGLLALAGEPHDRVLEHSLIFALIEIGAREETATGLRSASSFSRRAALIALDQMDGGGLKAEMVTPLFFSPVPVLQQTASWIASHHPEWGQQLAGYFSQRLQSTNLSDAEREELQRQLSQFARNPSIQELLASTLSDTTTASVNRQLVLRSIAQASLKQVPGVWTNALKQALGDADEAILQDAIGAVRALPVAKTNATDFSEQLLVVARDATRPANLRLDALAALPSGLPLVEPELFDFLRASLDPTLPPMVRTTVAGVIGRARLSEDQLIKLTDSIKTAGPLEISNLLGVFDSTTNEIIGLKLITALKESKGLAGLRVDMVKPRFEKFSASVQEEGKTLLALVNVDLEKQKAHLDDLVTSLQTGDIRRGQAIFNSPKAACASCHAIGYLGGQVGPDLTSIGQIRTERDLLESIVYPSASFVRSYEPVLVITKSGEPHNGVLRQDAADEILLATGPGTEVRIARADIAEMRPSSVSVMPGGLDEQLSRQELADLVAFLKGTKWGAH